MRGFTFAPRPEMLFAGGANRSKPPWQALNKKAASVKKERCLNIMGLWLLLTIAGQARQCAKKMVNICLLFFDRLTVCCGFKLTAND
jgi:hypothetical protein